MRNSLKIILLLAIIIFTGCNVSNAEKKEEGKTVESGTPAVTTEYKLHGIPVLMYHSIGIEAGNPIVMPVEQFDEEMKYLKDQGYKTLTLNELYDYFENRVPVPDKSVVITLDDGYVDNYTSAFPVLKKYGIKATIFVVTSTIDVNPKCLTSSQIKELDKAGIEIESHTVTHRDLDSLSYEEQYNELKESKSTLEKLLDKPVGYVAYPTGKYNDDTLKAVANAGYRMAFSTNGRWSDKSDGIFTLDRVYISTFHNMDVFRDRLTNPQYEIQ
ncbi:MAG: polysaccharide deacetylase family protein [Clostridiaceae bacterium]